LLLSGSNNRATVTATATALRNEMIEFGFQLEKYAKRDAKIMQIAAAAAAAAATATATATAATSNSGGHNFLFLFSLLTDFQSSGS